MLINDKKGTTGGILIFMSMLTELCMKKYCNVGSRSDDHAAFPMVSFC